MRREWYLSGSLRQRAWLWCALALLAVLACVREATGKQDVLQTNLLALLPATERSPVAESAINRLADVTANRTVFLVGMDSADRAADAAVRFGQALRDSGTFTSVTVQIDAAGAGLWREWLKDHRFRLLTEAERLALEQTSSPEAWLTQRLQTRLVSPWSAPLGLDLVADPFGLSQGWAAELPLRSLRLAPERGVLMVHEAGRSWALVHATLAGSAYDKRVGQRVLDAVMQAQATLGGAELLRAGTVFHAEFARRQAEADIDFIGAGSLIGMLLLLYGVFRSVRPLLAAVVTVLFGVAAASAVTVAWYGHMHLITLVFGVSLIGEAVDYAVQYFAAHLDAGPTWDSQAALRRMAPGLTVALGTSLLGYGALWWSPFVALSQIALFAIVGLIAAWLTVFLLLPMWMRRPYASPAGQRGALQQRWLELWRRHMTRKACIGLALTLLTLSATGWVRLQGRDDVRLLVATDADQAQQEERIKALTGLDSSSQFFLIEGHDEEEILRREEALRQALAPAVARGDLQSYQAVSSFVPSQARQQAALDAWSHVVFTPPTRLPEILAQAGLQDEIAPALRREFEQQRSTNLHVAQWLEHPLSTPWRQLWIDATPQGQASVLLPMSLRAGVDLSAVTTQVPGTHWVDKPASVSRLFSQYRLYSAYWLVGAVALVYGLLALRYGARSALGVLLPTLLALAVSLGAYGWLGRPLTLFNMMALVLVLGVGVNYAIFLYEGGARSAITFAGVQLSAATTLLSFGLLAWSSMPVLAGFGTSLAWGIACAVLLSPMALSFASQEARA